MRLLDRAYWVTDTLREHRWLERSLAIGPRDLVLDVGSGASPHFRSNVLCDKFLWDGTERHGEAVLSDRPFIVGDVQRLPFRDGAFDFVICSHVLEHVEDPAAAVRELARVAQRGYIETPSAEWERVSGFPFHRWMVSVRDGRLVFRQKRGPIEDPELANWFTALENQLSLRRYIWLRRRRAGVYTYLLWHNEIPFEVDEAPGERKGFLAADVLADAPTPGKRINVVKLGPVARAVLAYGRFRRRTSDISWSQLLPLLCCPGCSGPLADGEGQLRCTACDASYVKDQQGRPWLLEV